MLLNEGDKILVIHRRIFENDKSRFFLGTVDAYELGICKISGFTFVRDPHSNLVSRKDEERTKIISLSSGTLFVYLIKQTSDISKLHFEHDSNGYFFLKEGGEILMDLTEIPHAEKSYRSY